MSRCALPIAAALAAIAGVPALAAGQGPVILYARGAAAEAIHDAGLTTAYRQGPALDTARWPGSHRLGKVDGTALSEMSASAMAAALREGWSQESAALVGVDEILPAHWSADDARRLRTALGLLGHEAGRVVFYAGPSLVEQVGRADPRLPLPKRLAEIVDAISRGRATFLLTFRGSLQPFPPREMATHPTRWIARWPAGRGTLHLLVGPDGGLGQAGLWNRVRSTPAGRALLSNGPGAIGLSTRGAGLAWLAAYRAHLRAPTAPPPGGDAAVSQPGGLGLRAVPGGVGVTIGRRGRAVLRLVPRRQRRGRVIRVLAGPTRGSVRVSFPPDARHGRYTAVAVLQGDGLRDVARIAVRVLRPRLGLVTRRGTLRITVPPKTRAVVRLVRRGVRTQVIAKLRGPLRLRVVRLPRDLRPGVYRAIAVSAGPAGRAVARARIHVRPRD